MKDIVNLIATALGNIDEDRKYFLDKEKKIIICSSTDLRESQVNHSLVKIDPMLNDIIDLMEDFSLEQDTEEVQEHLLSSLKDKNSFSAAQKFDRTLIDYPRSKKRWQEIIEKWLTDRANEFVDDYNL